MKKLIWAGLSLLVLCLVLSACDDNPKPGDKMNDCDNLPGLAENCNADAIFYLRDNWRYSTISGKRNQDLEALFSTIYPQYAAIFGEDVMSYKLVIIYDSLEGVSSEEDSSEDDFYPYTSPHGEYTVITLAVGDPLLWAREIYQLSHEMTHYAFDSLEPDISIEKGDWDDNFSRWNEEIICEAMSLRMLNYMSENWAGCSLSRDDPGYGAKIGSYMQKEYDKAGNSPLKCDTKEFTCEGFKAISETADEVEYRPNHMAERNYCYNLFKEYDADAIKVIGEVLNMYEFYNSDYDFIDFTSWEKNSQYPDFVKELSRIQPTILMNG